MGQGKKKGKNKLAVVSPKTKKLNERLDERLVKGVSLALLVEDIFFFDIVSGKY